jgi:quercetin dioxygenase-like cupin family protein
MMAGMDGAIVIPPDDGERLRRGDSTYRVLAELAELEAVELTFEPGWEGVDPHSHDDHVDSFYVLEGEVEFVVGERTLRGGAGTYVAIPRGVVHGFRNAGPGRIRVLNVHAPAVGFIDRLRGG